MYIKLRLYNYFVYGGKLTKDDIIKAKVISTQFEPFIFGTKKEVKRLKDLAYRYYKWY